MSEFKLPELGEGVHEGELIRWGVQPGDQVQFDQILCEIMTDKATMEIPSSHKGKVLSLHAKVGDTVTVGQTLIQFASLNSLNSLNSLDPLAGPSHKPEQPQKEKSSASEVAGPAAPSTAVHKATTHAPLASPLTRKRAFEAGIDLSQVAGSGPHGRVLLADLAASGNASPKPLLEPIKSTPGVEKRIPILGLRKKIAQKMRQSKDHAAHFTYVEEADMTALVTLRNKLKPIAQQAGTKLTYLPFVFKAMVAALKEFPTLNALYDEKAQELVLKSTYHFGLSIQTEDGLIAPVVKNVDQSSILELAKKIELLSQKAKTKKLELSDLSESSITVTNIGSIGGLFATPIINYPEVAILGLNKIFRKPVVKMIAGHEQIVIADWSYFSISLDHRVIDGAIAANFMKTFIAMIQDPEMLLLH